MDIIEKKFETKKEIYDYILENLEGIRKETGDVIARLANTSALLMMEMPGINWAGFYLLKEGQLVLGPFQGKPAVAVIDPESGVCGAAVRERKIQLENDVHKCSYHIACDMATSSEIVLPLFSGQEIAGVLDIDSPLPGRFDEDDRDGLAAAAGEISAWL